ncbi:MAG: NEW3 domain-containing protein [Actinobacteria bacterium]|nr:NEW3 domain-containing protein [Actinomycetota bacterium]
MLKNKGKILLGSFLLITVLVFVFSFSLAFAQTEETTEVPKIEEKITLRSSYPELKVKGSTPQIEFKADIGFIGEEEKTINLSATGPQGWYIAILPSYENTEISAIRMKPITNESLKLIMVPLTNMEPGDYTFTLKASTDNIEATLDLKGTITATYELGLSTSSGRLDTKVTAGKDNHLALQIKNNGSASIENITFASDKPEGWVMVFKPDKIDKLDAGQTKDVDLVIKPETKTIAGDYMTTLKASGSENSSSNIDVRVTVLTPTVWGWVGIAIIIIVVVGVAVIFVRLGRR